VKLARLTNTPSALLDFYQEGLEALGAVCERTWHDRLQLVAEGPAARLWDPKGALLETELHFVPLEDSAPRQADREVFAGCPLTFRLAEELRSTPLPFERGVLEPVEPPKPPAPEVAEKLWHAQMPGASRWKLQGTPASDWHFSLLVLARCEIQAIDQHWTLHRLAISLPDGARDESLARSLDFSQLAASSGEVQWPAARLDLWHPSLMRAFEQELDSDLREIRLRQQRYLRRELDRIDSYFEQYESELAERHRRSHAEGTRMKAEERLAAAKGEHARRRQDQIHRHEIRVLAHLDALLLLAEPAWRATVSFDQKGESRTVSALFVPRARRWIAEDQ
jgi:hypothetical protein